MSRWVNVGGRYYSTSAKKEIRCADVGIIKERWSTPLTHHWHSRPARAMEAACWAGDYLPLALVVIGLLIRVDTGLIFGVNGKCLHRREAETASTNQC
ncbi:hypothetical protein ElyMa_005781900 [Elysia marginata]|uniref:Uncharacterized protein n=1 Tax=Elysia marginata TaxID=1093978 RepID=A0AAV4FTV3_9GAST|nr:hypothetical protein ElyMa_005781900 [Elysia marginata]